MLKEAHKYSNGAQFVLHMHLAHMVRLAQRKNFGLRAFLMIVLIKSIKDSKTFAREPVLFQRVSVSDALN